MRIPHKAGIGAVVLLALVGVSFIVWQLRGSDERSSTEGASVEALQNASSTEGTVQAPGSNTVVLGGASGILVPSLSRLVPETSPNLDATAREAAVKYLNTSITNLEKNKESYQDWVNLGLARLMLGEYAGAEEVWIFCTKLAPGEPVAFENLGNLYMSYIQDGAKSENYYKQAIVLNPKNTNNYRSLAELYTYHFKQNTNAVEIILKEGVSKNATAYDLGVLLARYYREKGMIAEAATAYTQAAAMATAAGRADIAESIKAEGAERK
jgi:cytochrome c-type biogenesis protein CcmH/NrfG